MITKALPPTATVLTLVLLTLAFGAAGCQGSDGGAGPADTPRFVDRAREFGLDVVTHCGSPEKLSILDSLGVGVAVFDFDGDGDLDLFVCGGSRIHEGRVARAEGPWLFRNDGQGRWADVTARSGLVWTGWAQGTAVADYDADGDLDLFVAQHGPDTLWRNEGGGTFRDVTQAAGLVADPYWGVSATWGDADGDGWPDLYVANYVSVDALKPPPPDTSVPGSPTFRGPASLDGEPDVLWRNRGDGTFEDATRATRVYAQGGKGMSALFCDLDGDRRADLVVTNDTQRNQLLHGLPGGLFVEEGEPAGVAYDAEGQVHGSMAVDAADVDGDGRLDLAVSNFRGGGTRFFKALPRRTYQDVTAASNSLALTARFVGWGMALADFDEDGRADLFQANGHVFPVSRDYAQPPLFLRNSGAMTFEDVTASWGQGLDALRSGRAVAAGDLDNDGDVDLVMTTMDGPLRVLINEAPHRAHAVTVRLSGARPNLEALGARVEVRVAGRTQVGVVRRGGSIMAASDAALHFGLGSAREIDELLIRWPDGSSNVHRKLPADVSLRVRQEPSSVEVSRFPSRG
ncbi:MAG: CRTAC1 family protein [Isosphaeraceae bacterium]